LGDLGTERKIILKWILKKEGVRIWNEIICHIIGSSGKLM